MGRDYRQYVEYNNFFGKRGWIVEKINGTFILIRHLPLVGSIIKIQRCDPKVSLQKIDRVAKRHRTLLIKLEPNLTTDDPRTPAILERLKKFGYEESRWALCPTRTIHINLGLDLDKLLAQTKKDVRRYLRKNRGKDFEFHRDKYFEDFYPQGKFRKSRLPAAKI